MSIGDPSVASEHQIPDKLICKVNFCISVNHLIYYANWDCIVNKEQLIVSYSITNYN